MLQARRDAEKDFILRKDAKYIGRHAAILHELEMHADEVLSFLSDAGVDPETLAENQSIRHH